MSRILRISGHVSSTEIEDFFRHYNVVNGKEFKPLDRSKPKKARQLIERGMEEFRQKQAGLPSGQPQPDKES
jgi:hypothetical protein